MEILSSTKNQFIKLARSLSDKKNREETGLFVVEGKNLLKDIPSFIHIEYVFATEARLEEAEALVEAHKEGDGARLFIVEESLVGVIADTVSPYGIVAVCKIPTEEFRLPTGKALLLDEVADPGNVGTILRTAAACDFQDVYLLGGADLYSPKVVRATLGGLFRVNTFRIDVDEARTLIRQTNSAVLDMNGEDILRADIPSKILFIAGNEAHGVRQEFKDLAKSVYSLPMKNGVESLNVAVATSVAMYKTV